MPEKTARRALDSTLKRLRAEAKRGFVATDDASSPHETLQRFVASGLRQQDLFDARVKQHELVGLHTVRRAPVTMADGRVWLQIAALADPHYGIGVHELDADDPELGLVDFEDGWDPERDAPSSTRALCRLSELLPKIQRRKSAAPQGGLVLDKVTWKGKLPHRPHAPVFRSGPALLTRGQQKRKGAATGSDLAQSLGIVEPDGSMQSVPYSGEHANYIAGAAWCGDDVIAVVGQRTNVLTSIGVVERVDGEWTLRELWSGPPNRPGAVLAPYGDVTGAPGIFSFVTSKSREAKESTIHLWALRDGKWRETKTVELPQRATDLSFASPERLIYAMHPSTRELVFEEGDWQKRKITTPMPYLAVDEGRVLKLDDKGLTLGVFENGTQVQRLPLGKNDGVQVAAHAGRVVAHVRSRVAGRDRGPAKLVGWRHENGKYTKWFQCEDPHSPPTGRAHLALAGDQVFAAEPGGGLYRLLVAEG